MAIMNVLALLLQDRSWGLGFNADRLRQILLLLCHMHLHRAQAV